MPTPYQLHVSTWGRGCGNTICQAADRVCLFRGAEIPVDVLFVGEAPGQSENFLGRPFVGPAGKLLDRIVERSIGEENLHRSADRLPPLSWGFTNLVGCFPRNPENGKPVQPDPDEIRRCRPRLADLVQVADPRLIVCVGSVAKKWLDQVVPHRQARKVDIVHPAEILRANVAHQGLMVQTAVVTISNVIDEVFRATPEASSRGG